MELQPRANTCMAQGPPVLLDAGMSPRHHKADREAGGHFSAPQTQQSVQVGMLPVLCPLPHTHLSLVCLPQGD